MPFDGVTLAGIVHELSLLEGGRVDKISQPERDEIYLNIRARGANHRVLLTANANSPRIGFTSQSKASPLQAPMFCMVLRKHISGGKIIAILQPDFERIVEIRIEALDEMGDRSEKTIILEIMGRHSNIMLCDANGRVLDAIKHVPPSVSAVRPILPGVTYSRPPSQGKQNPLAVTEDTPLAVPLYKNFTGISPVMSEEICHRATLTSLNEAFFSVFQQIKANSFDCAIYRDDDGKAYDIAVLPFSVFGHLSREKYDSASRMLEDFYLQRTETFRIGQKTADMRKLINTHLERCRKKAVVFEKTLDDIKNRDDHRINGELITAYLYMIKSGIKSFIAENFYDDNKPVEIALDPQLTPSENAQKYFKLYNKQKRAYAALQDQIESNNTDIVYLESIAVAMETVIDEADISEIRAELAEQGFIKKRGSAKKVASAAKPLKYIVDGFDIYVGKNNTQNDYLTMKMAKNNDIWFHTKDIAGSHVILVTRGREPSEIAIKEAANLAAYNSRARASGNVPVDYVAKKHVKKPAGAKPGYVIYDYYKTIYVTPQKTVINKGI
ncbi:MAG: NFACT family protein [Defluviitaleaceae bacterium]|nr:NFACT family protein [Defluviitaleaceae bacterium]